MRKINRFLFLFVAFLLFFVNSVTILAQQVNKTADFEISGIVKDNLGEPALGATIMVENTTIGTTTDLDGKFNLKVPAKSTIKVSYIGYNPQVVKITDKKFYEIILQASSIALDEVVAVGYGTQSKATITTGIASVKKDELKSGVSVSPLNNLQGKVAGLDIRQTTGQP
ncbi:MAG: carboxypeptidase-like regulatory domain-containing protein, partial [Bacteroidales bacterium]